MPFISSVAEGLAGVSDEMSYAEWLVARVVLLICHDDTLCLRTYAGISTNQVKALGSECQTSGACSMKAKQAIKKDNAAGCFCFLNYLAFLRPEAIRARVSPLYLRRSHQHSSFFAYLPSLSSAGSRSGSSCNAILKKEPFS
jgi:hypothetical protein